MVCPEGHMAIRKVSKRPKKHKKDGKGTVETYFFDVNKCKICPLKDGCYKDGARTKSYSVSIKSRTHQDHLDFQESEYFKTRAKERYKIEAKNSEMKHSHGFASADSHDLFGMNLQAAHRNFRSQYQTDNQRIDSVIGVYTVDARPKPKKRLDYLIGNPISFIFRLVFQRSRRGTYFLSPSFLRRSR